MGRGNEIISFMDYLSVSCVYALLPIYHALLPFVDAFVSQPLHFTNRVGVGCGKFF